MEWDDINVSLLTAYCRFCGWFKWVIKQSHVCARCTSMIEA